jgi:hypothetical protein
VGASAPTSSVIDLQLPSSQYLNDQGKEPSWAVSAPWTPIAKKFITIKQIGAAIDTFLVGALAIDASTPLEIRY